MTLFQIVCTCYRLTDSFSKLFWNLKNCIKSSQSELYSDLPFKEYCRIALENEKTIQNYKKDTKPYENVWEGYQF